MFTFFYENNKIENIGKNVWDFFILLCFVLGGGCFVFFCFFFLFLLFCQIKMGFPKKK